MLSGSQNIGVVNFRRNLQFRKQYAFNVIPSIVSFGVTIAAAIILRNYWALVIGIMSEYVVTLILSYTMEPFRPRFCISKVAEIWSFSIWSLWLNLGRYLNDLLDRVSIGGFAGAAEMGRYYVATDVAGAPTQELVAPMVSVLLPVMSKAQNDRAQLRTLYLAVLYWSALMSASTSIGVALVTDDLVDFALGPQWQDAKSLLPWLALSFGTLGMAASVYTTLTTIGLVRFAARLQWTRLCMMALAIVPMAFFYKDVDYIAKTRFVLTVLVTPMLFYALMKPLELTLKDVAVTLWRPLAAGAVMAIAVLGLNAVLPFAGTGRLFLDAATGALTYALTLMLLWLAVGRPDGPERKVWNVLGAQLARWRM